MKSRNLKRYLTIAIALIGGAYTWWNNNNNSTAQQDAPVPSGNFEMAEVGRDTWVSPAGLRYKGRDPQGKTRKEHVLRHAQDQPSRAGSHGVFDANGDAVFELVDEAWRKVKEKKIRSSGDGRSDTYLVPMGRKIGYLGGQNGARRGKPALKSVFIVVRKGTKDVVTAYPK